MFVFLQDFTGQGPPVDFTGEGIPSVNDSDMFGSVSTYIYYTS